MADHASSESSLKLEIAALRRQVQELEAEVGELERTRVLLREEHSFRRGVIERAAEGICVCHEIEEHPFVRFTVWNHRMEDLTGYSIEEINRRTVTLTAEEIEQLRELGYVEDGAQLPVPGPDR